MTIHERIYTVMLIVMAFMLAMSAGVMFFVIKMVESRDPSQNMWPMWMVVFIELAYLFMIMLTLALRWLRPGAGKLVSMALNVILITFFPIGTAVGVYGFWKVNRPCTSDQNIAGM